MHGILFQPLTHVSGWHCMGGCDAARRGTWDFALLYGEHSHTKIAPLVTKITYIKLDPLIRSQVHTKRIREWVYLY
eukprot:COSAG05_NODE_1974_length_3765_cov_19.906983_1_plen_76_part_00